MPMPIHREDERGNKLSNLPQVMGRVPWLEQVKAMLGLFAVNGVQFKRARDLLSDMVSDASGLEEIERTLDSLFQQAGGGPKNSAAS